jgi:3-deoxy-D-manno-octulosonic-acid transferase
VHAVRFPFDFSFAVERLLDRVGPDAIGLMELETWPNFLSIAQSRRIPVVLINGRLSEKSFPRYMLIRPVMAWMLRKIAWMGVQTPAIAGRMAALGAPRQRMEVIPTLKYDNAEVASHVAGQDELAAAMGLSVGHQLFVAGSTGPGEEEAVLAMVEALQGRYPALRVAIAPRHPEVVPQVIEASRRRGLTPVLRSEWPDGKGRGQDAHATLGTSDVFVLNTMGELRKLYALSFVVFVGRSLFKKGGGGSDMIEVAALGKLCCFGPFTSNFAEVVELLVKEGTAVQLSEGREMADVVGKWLADPAEARAMGRRAQELIRRQQGSTERYVRQLMAVLGCSAGQ